mgnify:CR=1 FL=1|jgi:rRNA maturation protein Nop10
MILKCPKCGKYALREECCTKTASAHPIKFSLSDKYGKYRRALKAKGYSETRNN